MNGLEEGRKKSYTQQVGCIIKLALRRLERGFNVISNVESREESVQSWGGG